MKLVFAVSERFSNPPSRQHCIHYKLHNFYIFIEAITDAFVINVAIAGAGAMRQKLYFMAMPVGSRYNVRTL
jgi:hypothetical protein